MMPEDWLAIPTGEPFVWASSNDVLLREDSSFAEFRVVIAHWLRGADSVLGGLPEWWVVLEWVDVVATTRLRALGSERSASMHNLGRMLASLTDPVRSTTEADVEDLCQALTGYASLPNDAPALAASAKRAQRDYRERLTNTLATLDDVALRRWLRSGDGPRPRPLVEVDLPESNAVNVWVKRLTNHPRLESVAQVLGQVVACVTLPSWDLNRNELPVGGYSSITTRGDLSSALVAQHALPDQEFLRRYSENELLYFERETPQVTVDVERVVILDQGVRTWGAVRSVLGASALALLQSARGRSRLVTRDDGDSIEDRLAASDLTPNPSELIRRTLVQPSESRRDVVLLTHPRTLHDPDVVAALSLAGPLDRVFAITSDRHGASVLRRVTATGSVTVREFRVNPPTPPEPPKALTLEWTADVLHGNEFPFRLPLVDDDAMCAVSPDGSRLFTVGSRGLLQIWSLTDTDTPAESVALPRGLTYLLPWRRGVLVFYDDRLLVVDAGERTARASDHAPVLPCLVAPDQDAVVGPHVEFSVASDGLREEEHADVSSANFVGEIPTKGRNAYALDRATGELEWRGKVWRPMLDGEPVLRGATIRRVTVEGDLLLLDVKRKDFTRTLVVGRNNGSVVAELALRPHLRVAWSQKGLVPVVDGTGIGVRDIGDGLREVRHLKSQADEVAATVGAALGRGFLFVVRSRVSHLIRWDRGRIERKTIPGQVGLNAFLSHDATVASLNTDERTWITKSLIEWPADARWSSPSEAPGGLKLSLDCFSHVRIADRNNRTLVIVYAHELAVALWSPTGTVYGPRSLTGRGSSPRALETLAGILTEAEA